MRWYLKIFSLVECKIIRSDKSATSDDDYLIDKWPIMLVYKSLRSCHMSHFLDPSFGIKMLRVILYLAAFLEVIGRKLAYIYINFCSFTFYFIAFVKFTLYSLKLLLNGHVFKVSVFSFHQCVILPWYPGLSKLIQTQVTSIIYWYPTICDSLWSAAGALMVIHSTAHGADIVRLWFGDHIATQAYQLVRNTPPPPLPLPHAPPPPPPPPPPHALVPSTPSLHLPTPSAHPQPLPVVLQ